MKLILISGIAAVVAAVSLAAVAQSAPNAQTVRVTANSYSFKLSAKPKPGAVKFVVRNAAKGAAHDMWIRGGGKTWKSRFLAPNGTATVTATLKKGVKYSIWCSVGSHAKKGMRSSFVAR
jgi:plastocyanin